MNKCLIVNNNNQAFIHLANNLGAFLKDPSMARPNLTYKFFLLQFLKQSKTAK
jgi:hypothetical protein